jgi:hypothetical protein
LVCLVRFFFFFFCGGSFSAFLSLGLHTFSCVFFWRFSVVFSSP